MRKDISPDIDFKTASRRTGLRPPSTCRQRSPQWQANHYSGIGRAGEQCHEQIKRNFIRLLPGNTHHHRRGRGGTAQRGKSISSVWFESGARNGSKRGHLQNLQIDVYVSTAGRIFSRLHAAGGTRRGFVGFTQAPNATAEQGPGSGGAKVGSVEFTGHSLLMTSVFESGARRLIIDFDGGFTSCQAKVLYGKEAGHSTIRHSSIFGGHTEEVGAIQISSVGCTVREGNVFTEY